MNKSTIIKYKDVFEHWLSGGEVQHKKPNGKWYDFSEDFTPSWVADVEYRIKPREPRVFWLNCHKECVVAHKTKASASREVGVKGKTIKVIELIDE